MRHPIVLYHLFPEFQVANTFRALRKNIWYNEAMPCNAGAYIYHKKCLRSPDTYRMWAYRFPRMLIMSSENNLSRKILYLQIPLCESPTKLNATFFHRLDTVLGILTDVIALPKPLYVVA
ncbi:hypothetical protein TNIN_180821 [Trichonephila inaurata madagascariensis]|uniref:Uncharacterized protein n=1 Tax=Trichonephila inaurata madagascariensis TaxID=2747483 RepID=A0A8X6MFW5_9ARAC|nr:hypothetical protein TNIN_180821 [Trichonephila inaurata madagascariensis]